MGTGDQRDPQFVQQKAAYRSLKPTILAYPIGKPTIQGTRRPATRMNASDGRTPSS